MVHELIHLAKVAAVGAAGGIVLFGVSAYAWLCFAPDREEIFF